MAFHLNKAKVHYRHTYHYAYLLIQINKINISQA